LQGGWVHLMSHAGTRTDAIICKSSAFP
jgi:hypothetical protein